LEIPFDRSNPRLILGRLAGVRPWRIGEPCLAAFRCSASGAWRWLKPRNDDWESHMHSGLRRHAG